ncbi:hypothetical protein HDU98_006662 [Podochytrium sp. JEL0797]|nr:hypothetical protein HDU98_006662 [Podochytrium sp. JEL0797]
MGKTAIIIGAGPAGIVTGIALRRQGFEVSVFDKTNLEAGSAPGSLPIMTFGEVGGSISLQGNGLRVLENLGVLDVVEALRVGNTDTANEINFLLIDGSDRIKLDLSTTKKGEHPPLHLLRATLHTVLLKAATQLGVRVFVGKKLKSLSQSDSHAMAQFEDGTTATGEILIAADGIHSIARRMVFENAPTPVCFGAGYLGVLDRQPDIDFDYTIGHYMDPLNSRDVFFNSQCGSTESAFAVFHLDPAMADTGREDWRPVGDLPGEAEALASLVESWGAPKKVGQLIRRAKRISPVNFYDLPDLDNLYKGRIALVGDAAHGTLPTYGQGLNQALEDAATLGDLFGHFQEPEEFAKVFEIYEQVRKPHVRKCSAASRQTASRMKAPNSVGMRIGRLMMRLIFTITNVFQLNDSIMYHNYREDLVAAVPDIKF